MMDTKKKLSFMGLLIICLVVSMPFYVADVYAVSVSITKNQGQSGMEGFLDAQGDTWTVEATVTGAQGVEAEKVKIKVGENEVGFNSCSESALGMACEYVSPLNDGIAAGVYGFDVNYYCLDQLGIESVCGGDSSSVKADGAAPLITINSISQTGGGNVTLDFLAADEPAAYCVGLEKIEILDREGGGVLQTIEGFEAGDCDYNYQEDVRFGGVLQASLEGEGRRWLKIRARDRLGHERLSSAVSLETDFVAPVIELVDFVELGDFIGEYEAETDIEVNITENGDYLEAEAYSEQAELNGELGECEPSEEVAGLWSCVWEEVKVTPGGTVSVRVVAEDGAGNEAERVLSKTFTSDTAAPRAASWARKGLMMIKAM